jgi:site-specific DNA-methyltransferase (cytosine-N4-specific)
VVPFDGLALQPVAFEHVQEEAQFRDHASDAAIPIHPARFPAPLPEFFIKLLTDDGDVVLDPFAGSNTAGAVAERLGRRWLAIDCVEAYLEGSKFRFE